MSFACQHEDLRLYAYGFLEPAEAAVLESHLLSCADCRRALADLNDESMLVAFELSLEPGESSAEPPRAVPVRRAATGRILAVAVAVAAVLLLLAVLHSVFSSGNLAPVPDRPETPVVVLPGTGDPPDPTALVAEQERAELLRRITELEEEVRRLNVAQPSEVVVPPAKKLELAVEEHDWAGLAEALRGVAPEIARGEMPSNPELLRAYLEALEALRDLAEEVGTPATVKEAARDPRTGPFLFAAALRQSWPEAPEQDIETATEVAETAMVEFQGAVAVAATPAERAAAETALTDVMAAEVQKLTETHGQPSIEPAVGSESEAEKPTVVPESTELEPRQPAESPEPADESTRATVTTDTVLQSAGIASVTNRVYRGTPKSVVAQVVKGWSTEYRVPDRSAAALALIAEGWVRSYQRALEVAAPGVVRAFEARLGRGTAPRGVAEEEILSLRDTLLGLQAAAEREVLRLGASAAGAKSARTFFLFD